MKKATGETILPDLSSTGYAFSFFTGSVTETDQPRRPAVVLTPMCVENRKGDTERGGKWGDETHEIADGPVALGVRSVLGKPKNVLLINLSVIVYSNRV